MTVFHMADLLWSSMTQCPANLRRLTTHTTRLNRNTSSLSGACGINWFVLSSNQ